MKPNFKHIDSTNNVLYELLNLTRWTWKINNRCLNELAKQALNCIATFMLACICEYRGKTINWKNFPKIALYRAYQKAHVYFDIPEYVLRDMCEYGNMDFENLEKKVTQEIITEKTDEEFCRFVSSANGTFEEQIYKAATKIATLVELVENKYKLHDMEGKQQDLDAGIRKYCYIPGVEEMSNLSGQYFEVLLDIAHLRNQTRWAVTPCNVKCNVLGHLFDTAVFAYFMSLEQNPEDEKTAARMFFMGIFHDVAETWTKDIPSPIKDKIPGFREITELYEMKVMEDNVYSKLPDFMSQRIREVMFEDEQNKEDDGIRKLVKGADYLAGDAECWRQYVAGSRDDYFRGAIERRLEGIDNGKVLLTPECKKLYVKFSEFADRCVAYLYYDK